MKNILLFVCLFAVYSCSEKYPTNFTKELPFGFEYNMPESKAYSIVDSLSKADVIDVYDDKSKFWYTFLCNKERITLTVSLEFYNNVLYKIDIRDNHYLLSNRGNKENYNLAIQFLKSQEINLVSYEKTKDYLSDKYEYEYKKYPYAISWTNNYILRPTNRSAYT